MPTNNDNDSFSAPSLRKKSGINAFDFSNMLVKKSALPPNGIATLNYFQALQPMEIRFESADVASNPIFDVLH